jgi:hypothetical protein
MLPAGDRNIQATFYRKLETNVDGTRTPRLVLHGARWANFKPAGAAREIELAHSFAPSAAYVVTVLHDRTLDGGLVASIDGSWYSVDGVTHDRLRAETTLFCSLMTGSPPAIAEA